MNKLLPLLIAGFVAVVCAVMILDLFAARLDHGDVYPPFSSLRADPIGTRAFYEALERTPGMRVERNMIDLQMLELPQGAALVVAGAVDSPDPEPLLEKLERFMEAGGRLIITLRPEPRQAEEYEYEGEGAPWPFDMGEGEVTQGEGEEERQEKEDQAKKSAEDKSKEEQAREEEESKLEKLMGYKFVNITERWNFKSGRSDLPLWRQGSVPVYVKLKDNALDLPEESPWFSPYYFLPEAEAWKTVYIRESVDVEECTCDEEGENSNDDTAQREAAEEEEEEDSTVQHEARIQDVPVVMYRDWGKGSLILASDTYFMSNEAMQFHRQPSLLSWIIGPHRHIIFDEMHMGIVRQTNLIDVIQQYRLTGLLLTALAAGLLFVWRNTVALTPRRGAQHQSHAVRVLHGRDVSDGLAALLKRCIPPTRLIHVCAQEYRASFEHDPAAGQYVKELLRETDENIAARDIPARYNMLSRKLRERMLGRHESAN